jgi:hypothetical protein
MSHAHAPAVFPVLPDLSTDAWPWPAPGRFRLGTEAHKRIFCRTLLDTFDPYRPAVIDWPRLDAETRARLTGLPIWDMAVQTEGQAMRRVKAYADVVDDPLLKKALELNAFEEGRHKLVLSNLVEAYGVELQPEPDYRRPADPEWCFLTTGFGECIDSFFAFGLFEAARRSGFFPSALVDTFEPVIAEEGRHILFFVNWVAWRRRTMAWWRRPWFELKIWAVWIVLALDRLSLAKGIDAGAVDAGDANFTVSAADQLTENVDVAALIELCLSENERRMRKYDSRLVRPTFVPALARLARALTKVLPRRTAPR